MGEINLGITSSISAISEGLLRSIIKQNDIHLQIIIPVGTSLRLLFSSPTALYRVGPGFK